MRAPLRVLVNSDLAIFLAAGSSVLTHQFTSRKPSHVHFTVGCLGGLDDRAARLRLHSMWDHPVDIAQLECQFEGLLRVARHYLNLGVEQSTQSE